MATRQSMAMLVALGLAGATWAAQNPATPDPADTQATVPPAAESSTTPSPDPSAASSPHQREVTKQPSDTETRPNASPDPQAASSPHQRGAIGEMPHAGQAAQTPKLVGMKVQSPSGQAIGSVVDVKMDASHQPEYVVISTGNDTMTAVPYSAAESMMKNGKLVVDRSRLQNSPQVAQSELQDKSDTKWRADADKYWGPIRSASPGKDAYPPQPQER